MVFVRRVGTVGALLIAALACGRAVVAGEVSRAEQWEKRHSPEAVAAAAADLLSMLVLGEQDLRVNGLFRRQGLIEITNLAKDGKDAEALAAFERYYFSKLRYPTQFGISVHDVNAYVRGVCGGGMWPGAALDPGADKAKTLAAADRLLRGVVLVDGKEVGFGEPGAVNWFMPYSQDSPPPPDKLPAGFVLHPTGFLSPLLEAYLLTHEDRYLSRWVDYMDDWAMSTTYVDGVHPCKVPDGLNGGPVVTLTRQLGAVVNALPADSKLIPPETLARVLCKALPDQLRGVAYLRSNTHNWTPGSQLMLAALLYDEFKVAPIFFREARRRNIEDNAVTQNLRDGTENQQCPWYNENYLGVAGAFRLMEARETLPVWAELPWVKEVRESLGWRAEIQRHLDEHVTYFIHFRTPQNEWPIGLRGGDKRTAHGIGTYYAAIAPGAYADPENLRIIAAMTKRGEGLRPTYTSEWFPYGGYNIVRQGWESDSGYGFLFCSPQPGAYGGFRSQSNNNVFGLGGFGQDLLVNDEVGHYMYPDSPIYVDGHTQFFHAGLYKVAGLSAHKVYQVSAWTEPAPWRWHASDRFNLMEGVYAGPYGSINKVTDANRYGPEQSKSPTLRLDQTIRGVTHQRLVHYVRARGLWIVTDRMLSDAPHEYRQVWRLPVKPSAVPAFQDTDIHIDAAARRITTDAKAETPAQGAAVAQANITLCQFSPAELAYDSQLVEKDPKNRYQMYGWREINVRWKGPGPQQIVTAIFPRAPGTGPEGDLKEIRPLDGPPGTVGFTATTPDGAVVVYAAAPDSDADLAAGEVKMRGEALLLDGDAGVALGCKSLSFRGRTVSFTTPDFEFSIRGGEIGAVVPIYRPIAPVVIGPDRNVFMDEIDVSMSSRTPGVEIRYTLDGTDPTPASTLYTAPVKLTHSATVMARAYRPGVSANPVQLSGTQATVASMAVFTRSKPIEPAAKLPVTEPGLSCAYYEGDWKRLWLRLDSLKPRKTGTAAALFDLSLVPEDNEPVGAAPAPRARYFAMVYSGYLEVPRDGVYTLHAPREYVMPDTEAGYELRVGLGDHAVPWGARTQVVGLNEWYPSTRLHAFGNWSIALKKGKHPFRVFYLDYRTTAARDLNVPGIRNYIWDGVTPDLRLSGPGIEPAPIPAEWLSHEAPRATRAAPTSPVVLAAAAGPAPAAAAEEEPPPAEQKPVILGPGDIGFKGESPLEKGWKETGKLPVAVVEDEGQKAVELKDESETELCGIAYALPPDKAKAMVENGFVLEMRLKERVSGGHMLVLRLKDLGGLVLSWGRDERRKRFGVSMYDPATRKNLSGSIAGLDRYVVLRLDYKPGKTEKGAGVLTVSLDGRQMFSLDVQAGKSPRDSIELGAIYHPERKADTLIEAFRLAAEPPPAP